MDDLIVGDLVIPGTELEERFDTPGGPGGQHANRTASAVTLRLDLATSSIPDRERNRLIKRYGDAIEVKANESRSQHLNRKVARERLAERITIGLRSQKKRKPTKPTGASREERLTAKKVRAEVKRHRRRPDPEDQT